MNNDNEIMKEFNETFSDKTSIPVEPYQATQNQNINTLNEFDNAINSNIQNSNAQNITMPNFVNSNSSVNIVPEVNNTVNLEESLVNINSTNAQIPNYNNDQQLYNTSNYINDTAEPIQKKTKKATIKINPELKTVFLLALVLLVAMAFVPLIFDFFDSLKLKLTG